MTKEERRKRRKQRRERRRDFFADLLLNTGLIFEFLWNVLIFIPRLIIKALMD